MPQGYFPVLLVTFRSFLVLRGGTHSILPKRRNPEFSEFWRFFLSLGGGRAQCLGGSTFSSFSNCFRTRSFCIFCNSYTYSHPFLANLVLYKQIWPIYGYSHISKTKKQAKLSSNLKQLKKEDLMFPTSNFAFFLLNTSQTEDRRPKIPN